MRNWINDQAGFDVEEAVMDMGSTFFQDSLDADPSWLPVGSPAFWGDVRSLVGGGMSKHLALAEAFTKSNGKRVLFLHWSGEEDTIYLSLDPLGGIPFSLDVGEEVSYARQYPESDMGWDSLVLRHLPIERLETWVTLAGEQYDIRPGRSLLLTREMLSMVAGLAPGDVRSYESAIRLLKGNFTSMAYENTFPVMLTTSLLRPCWLGLGCEDIPPVTITEFDLLEDLANKILTYCAQDPVYLEQYEILLKYPFSDARYVKALEAFQD